MASLGELHEFITLYAQLLQTTDSNLRSQANAKLLALQNSDKALPVAQSLLCSDVCDSSGPLSPIIRASLQNALTQVTPEQAEARYLEAAVPLQIIALTFLRDGFVRVLSSSLSRHNLSQTFPHITTSLSSNLSDDATNQIHDLVNIMSVSLTQTARKYPQLLQQFEPLLIQILADTFARCLLHPSASEDQELLRNGAARPTLASKLLLHLVQNIAEADTKEFLASFVCRGLVQGLKVARRRTVTLGSESGRSSQLLGGWTFLRLHTPPSTLTALSVFVNTYTAMSCDSDASSGSDGLPGSRELKPDIAKLLKQLLRIFGCDFFSMLPETAYLFTGVAAASSRLSNEAEGEDGSGKGVEEYVDLAESLLVTQVPLGYLAWETSSIAARSRKETLAAEALWREACADLVACTAARVCRLVRNGDAIRSLNARDEVDGGVAKRSRSLEAKCARFLLRVLLTDFPSATHLGIKEAERRRDILSAIVGLWRTSSACLLSCTGVFSEVHDASEGHDASVGHDATKGHGASEGHGSEDARRSNILAFAGAELAHDWTMAMAHVFARDRYYVEYARRSGLLHADESPDLLLDGIRSAFAASLSPVSTPFAAGAAAEQAMMPPEFEEATEDRLRDLEQCSDVPSILSAFCQGGTRTERIANKDVAYTSAEHGTLTPGDQLAMKMIASIRPWAVSLRTHSSQFAESQCEDPCATEAQSRGLVESFCALETFTDLCQNWLEAMTASFDESRDAVAWREKSQARTLLQEVLNLWSHSLSWLRPFTASPSASQAEKDWKGLGPALLLTLVRFIKSGLLLVPETLHVHEDLLGMLNLLLRLIPFAPSAAASALSLFVSQKYSLSFLPTIRSTLLSSTLSPTNLVQCLTASPVAAALMGRTLLRSSLRIALFSGRMSGAPSVTDVLNDLCSFLKVLMNHGGGDAAMILSYSLAPLGCSTWAADIFGDTPETTAGTPVHTLTHTHTQGPDGTVQEAARNAAIAAVASGILGVPVRFEGSDIEPAQRMKFAASQAVLVSLLSPERTQTLRAQGRELEREHSTCQGLDASDTDTHTHSVNPPLPTFHGLSSALERQVKEAAEEGLERPAASFLSSFNTRMKHLFACHVILLLGVAISHREAAVSSSSPPSFAGEALAEIYKLIFDALAPFEASLADALNRSTSDTLDRSTDGRAEQVTSVTLSTGTPLSLLLHLFESVGAGRVRADLLSDLTSAKFSSRLIPLHNLLTRLGLDNLGQPVLDLHLHLCRSLGRSKASGWITPAARDVLLTSLYGQLSAGELVSSGTDASDGQVGDGACLTTALKVLNTLLGPKASLDVSDDTDVTEVTDVLDVGNLESRSTSAEAVSPVPEVAATSEGRPLDLRFATLVFAQVYKWPRSTMASVLALLDSIYFPLPLAGKVAVLTEAHNHWAQDAEKFTAAVQQQQSSNAGNELTHARGGLPHRPLSPCSRMDKDGVSLVLNCAARYPPLALRQLLSDLIEICQNRADLDLLHLHQMRLTSLTEHPA